MNKKFKVILIIVFFATILGTGYYFLFSKPDRAGNTVAANTFGWKFPVTKFPTVGSNSNQIAYSDIRDPGGIPQGLPIRLQIPVIGVDSAIEDALINPDGKMDVPSGSVNVAWFALGPHPGQIGSAVIGGHFGIRNGIKFVFYDLDKLKVGDKVYIENDKGDTVAFQVRSIELFDRNADATTVFTSDDGLAHLNLITCEGIWNQNNGNYPQRRVVFTDAITGEGAVTVTKTSVFQQTLRIGAHGANVTALQTALQKKGFFAISSKIDGSYGKITRAAVAKFQTSVGLSSDGVFGPLTRIKLASELAVIQSPVSVISGLPSAGITIPQSSSLPQTFLESLKSLYATGTDGLITSIFIIVIVFLVIKIIL